VIPIEHCLQIHTDSSHRPASNSHISQGSHGTFLSATLLLAVVDALEPFVVAVTEGIKKAESSDTWQTLAGSGHSDFTSSPLAILK
jgi:hypothetical protein